MMGVADELQKLEELRRSGGISLEEYNKAKSLILRHGAAPQAGGMVYVPVSSQSNSFKFATAVWMIAGLFIPLWPISLPFCWFMAYRSYKND